MNFNRLKPILEAIFKSATILSLLWATSVAADVSPVSQKTVERVEAVMGKPFSEAIAQLFHEKEACLERGAPCSTPFQRREHDYAVAYRGEFTYVAEDVAYLKMK